MMVGFWRSRRASAAAPSARRRSAGVSDGCTPSTSFLRRGMSLSKRVSGVVWPSIRITIAASPPPSESRIRRTSALAASMRVASPSSPASRAFIEAEASSKMTTLRASSSASPSSGSSAATRSSASMRRTSSRESSRLSRFHSEVASFSRSTRCHSIENGTSKRRRRILSTYATTARPPSARAAQPMIAVEIGVRKVTWSSAQEPAGAEDAQDQLVERDAGVGAEVRDRPRGAVLAQLVHVLLVLAAVGLEQRAGHGDLLGLAGLAVDQGESAVQARVGLALVEHLHHERLELVVAQLVDPLLEAARVVEVAQHHRQAAPLVAVHEAVHAL